MRCCSHPTTALRTAPNSSLSSSTCCLSSSPCPMLRSIRPVMNSSRSPTVLRSDSTACPTPFTPSFTVLTADARCARVTNLARSRNVATNPPPMPTTKTAEPENP
eukprot:CAMPEP_0172638464 /NCGR_PEP_ID=MMETSP1068-20121228/213890_1 /TAXON_ID=35684 /ORGANISM="Pseudopedinella elastica, Strain CCMP716" /LENGTH=104 /DNA_ID=CAMNT_0013451359 /DNA_START=486 /DNA_END=800 /DNA_ORIENTATION=+